MSNILSYGGTSIPQLFHDLVFGRGIHPKPDIFGDEDDVSLDDVVRLLDVFVRHHGKKDKDGNIRVGWAEVDLVYKGPIFARPNMVLRSERLVTNAARYLSLLDLGGIATYGWIEAMLYANHEGFLYNFNDQELDPDALRPNQLWAADVLERSSYLNARRFADFSVQDWDEITFDMRRLFGSCVKGNIDKFKAYVDAPPSRQCDAHTVGRTLFIDASCRVHAGAIMQEAVRLERSARD